MELVAISSSRLSEPHWYGGTSCGKRMLHTVDDLPSNPSPDAIVDRIPVHVLEKC